MVWLVENWYVILGVLWLAIVLLAVVFFRRHPDATGARVFFFLLPFADPHPTPSPRPTPRAIALFALGMLILLLAMLFVPGFV